MIIKNMIQCVHCKDIIESIHRHDFKYCSCKTVYVDGGKDYLKRGFKNEHDFIDLSETISQKVFCIMGYTSSGKDSIVNKVSNELNIPMLVSHTSRPIRDGEIDGKSYYFVDNKYFRDNSHKFLETRHYDTKYGTWRYGLSEDELKGKQHSLFIVDRQGYEELACKLGEDNLISIFVEVDLDTLKERQSKRGDCKQEYVRRVKDDIKRFEGFISDYVVYNDNLDETVKRVKDIILEEMDS